MRLFSQVEVVAEPLAHIDATIGTVAEQPVIHTVWPEIENVAIDVGGAVAPAAHGYSVMVLWN